MGEQPQEDVEHTEDEAGDVARSVGTNREVFTDDLIKTIPLKEFRDTGTRHLDKIILHREMGGEEFINVGK